MISAVILILLLVIYASSATVMIYTNSEPKSVVSAYVCVITFILLGLYLSILFIF